MEGNRRRGGGLHLFGIFPPEDAYLPTSRLNVMYCNDKSYVLQAKLPILLFVNKWSIVNKRSKLKFVVSWFVVELCGRSLLSLSFCLLCISRSKLFRTNGSKCRRLKSTPSNIPSFHFQISQFTFFIKLVRIDVVVISKLSYQLLLQRVITVPVCTLI